MWSYCPSLRHSCFWIWGHALPLKADWVICSYMFLKVTSSFVTNKPVWHLNVPLYCEDNKRSSFPLFYLLNSCPQTKFFAGRLCLFPVTQVKTMLMAVTIATFLFRYLSACISSCLRSQMRALWSCFCVLPCLPWPSWMNRQRSRKRAPNSTVGSWKSLSDGDCMSPLKHEWHAWDLFICSTYEIPGCCQINKEMGLYVRNQRNSPFIFLQVEIRQKPILIIFFLCCLPFEFHNFQDFSKFSIHDLTNKQLILIFSNIQFPHKNTQW